MALRGTDLADCAVPTQHCTVLPSDTPPLCKKALQETGSKMRGNQLFFLTMDDKLKEMQFQLRETVESRIYCSFEVKARNINFPLEGTNTKIMVYPIEEGWN